MQLTVLADTTERGACDGKAAWSRCEIQVTTIEMSSSYRQCGLAVWYLQTYSIGKQHLKPADVLLPNAIAQVQQLISTAELDYPSGYHALSF
jgi:hypothetical protein